jgi:hypothetical protein
MISVFVVRVVHGVCVVHILVVVVVVLLVFLLLVVQGKTVETGYDRARGRGGCRMRTRMNGET